VALNIANLSDKAREDLVNSIVKMAPESALYKGSTLVQNAVAQLNASHGVYKTAGSKAAATAAQLKDDNADAESARKTNDKDLIMLKGLVENTATSEGDITGIALKSSARRGRGALLSLVPPEAIDIELPKTARGYLWVAAHEGKDSRGKYVAQVSPDPATPTTWENIPGFGKQRKLSGPSGTRLWVRFARVRGQSQSDWSAPVLVTIP
jgi:hypothetical protein